MKQGETSKERGKRETLSFVLRRHAMLTVSKSWRVRRALQTGSARVGILGWVYSTTEGMAGVGWRKRKAIGKSGKWLVGHCMASGGP